MSLESILMVVAPIFLFTVGVIVLPILEKISSHDLNQCELTCDSDTN